MDDVVAIIILLTCLAIGLIIGVYFILRPKPEPTELEDGEILLESPKENIQKKIKEENKGKFIEILWFGGLGLYAVGFLVFLFYKLSYAAYYDLSPILIERFADKVIICQSIVMELLGLCLLKDLAQGKKWYNQILIYAFSFVIAYGITGGIMGIVDLISGRPYSIL